jgi:hypothetical protein
VTFADIIANLHNYDEMPFVVGLRLKHLTDWNDGLPGTELNFKFYRQATNKIVGISNKAAAFLSKCF